MRELDLCLGARDVGLGRLDGNFERTLVERKEEVAFLYVRAFLEVHLLDESADARPEFDARHGLEAAGVFVPGLDAFCERRRDRYRECRRRGLSVRVIGI